MKVERHILNLNSDIARKSCCAEPCLALPFEGVRLGAELDGRHGGRAEGRSSQVGGPRRGRKQGESGGQSGHG